MILTILCSSTDASLKGSLRLATIYECDRNSFILILKYKPFADRKCGTSAFRTSVPTSGKQALVKSGVSDAQSLRLYFDRLSSTSCSVSVGALSPICGVSARLNNGKLSFVGIPPFVARVRHWHFKRGNLRTDRKGLPEVLREVQLLKIKKQVPSRPW